MGARQLFETAARLEAYCENKRDDFILMALPLFFLEWDEACKGFMLLAGDPQTAAPQSQAGTEALLNYLREFRLKEAKQAIRSLIDHAEEADKKALAPIEAAIANLDYGEAERLLQAFTKTND
ncbi:hypothetical protein AGMMS49546_32880 [Spirochaetia bacterium]|nr:hypothetical protein AGMMS49546_32880 [Spirochaetia bacterium]